MAQAYDFISKIVSLGDSGSGKSSLTIRLCEGRFVSHHDVTIGVEFGSRIVPVGPPASLEYNINNPSAAATAPGTTPSVRPAAAAPPRPPPNNAKSGKAASAAPPKEPEQKHMKLSLWDTAGQETYKSITRSYFRGASGALLVFDITRRSTFASVTAWLHDLRQIAEDDIVVILVGNKSDLAGASPAAGHGGGGAVAGDDPPPAVGGRRQVTRQEAEQWCAENRVLQYVETSAKSGENVERAFLEVAERIYQNIEAGKYDLNDRRSGVKGPGAGGGGASRTVKVVGTDQNAAKKAGGKCC